MQISTSHSSLCWIVIVLLLLLQLVECSDFGKIYSVEKYNSKQVFETTYESSTYKYEGFHSPSDNYPLPSNIAVSFRYQFHEQVSKYSTFSFTFNRSYRKYEYSIDIPLIQNVTILNATILLDAMFGIFNVDIENQLSVRIGDSHFTKLNQSLKEESEFGSQIASVDQFYINLNLSKIFTTLNSTSVSLIFELGDAYMRNLPISQWAKLSCPSSYRIVEESVDNSNKFTTLGFWEGPVPLNDPNIPKFKLEEMNRVRVQDIEDSYSKRPGFEYTILKSYMFYESNIFYENLLLSYIQYNFIDSNGNFTDIYGRNVTIDLNAIFCGARVGGYKYGDKISDYSFEENNSNDYSRCDRGTFHDNTLIVFYGKVLNGPLPPVPVPSFIENSPAPKPVHSKAVVVSSSIIDENKGLIIGLSVGLGLFGIGAIVSVIAIAACIIVKRKQKYAYHSVQ